MSGSRLTQLIILSICIYSTKPIMSRFFYSMKYQGANFKVLISPDLLSIIGVSKTGFGIAYDRATFSDYNANIGIPSINFMTKQYKTSLFLAGGEQQELKIFDWKIGGNVSLKKTWDLDCIITAGANLPNTNLWILGTEKDTYNRNIKFDSSDESNSQIFWDYTTAGRVNFIGLIDGSDFHVPVGDFNFIRLYSTSQMLAHGLETTFGQSIITSLLCPKELSGTVYASENDTFKVEVFDQDLNSLRSATFSDSFGNMLEVRRGGYFIASYRNSAQTLIVKEDLSIFKIFTLVDNDKIIQTAMFEFRPILVFGKADRVTVYFFNDLCNDKCGTCKFIFKPDTDGCSSCKDPNDTFDQDTGNCVCENCSNDDGGNNTGGGSNGDGNTGSGNTEGSNTSGGNTGSDEGNTGQSGGGDDDQDSNPKHNNNEDHDPKTTKGSDPNLPENSDNNTKYSFQILQRKDDKNTFEISFLNPVEELILSQTIFFSDKNEIFLKESINLKKAKSNLYILKLKTKKKSYQTEIEIIISTADLNDSSKKIKGTKIFMLKSSKPLVNISKKFEKTANEVSLYSSISVPFIGNLEILKFLIAEVNYVNIMTLYPTLYSPNFKQILGMFHTTRNEDIFFKFILEEKKNKAIKFRPMNSIFSITPLYLRSQLTQMILCTFSALILFVLRKKCNNLIIWNICTQFRFFFEIMFFQILCSAYIIGCSNKLIYIFATLQGKRNLDWFLAISELMILTIVHYCIYKYFYLLKNKYVHLKPQKLIDHLVALKICQNESFSMQSLPLALTENFYKFIVLVFVFGFRQQPYVFAIGLVLESGLRIFGLFWFYKGKGQKIWFLWIINSVLKILMNIAVIINNFREYLGIDEYIISKIMTVILFTIFIEACFLRVLLMFLTIKDSILESIEKRSITKIAPVNSLNRKEKEKVSQKLEEPISDLKASKNLVNLKLDSNSGNKFATSVVGAKIKSYKKIEKNIQAKDFFGKAQNKRRSMHRNSVKFFSKPISSFIINDNKKKSINTFKRGRKSRFSFNNKKKFTVVKPKNDHFSITRKKRTTSIVQFMRSEKEEEENKIVFSKKTPLKNLTDKIKKKRKFEF